MYSSTCFGCPHVHHQELNDCSGILWFYLRILVIVVLCSWSDRPAGPTTNNRDCYLHAPTVKPEATTAAVELLMMGVRTPGTCWTVHRRQVINLRIVASGWLIYLKCMIKHGIAKFKFKILTPEIVVLTPISENRAADVLNSLGASQPKKCNSIPSSDKNFHPQNVHTVSVTHPAAGLFSPGLKRPERESHRYTLSSVQVMSAIITPTQILTSCTGNFKCHRVACIYNSLY
jgi:hypothetical protein